MIGVTVAVVLATSSFALGMLALHWRADHIVMWQMEVTSEQLYTALQYYVHTVGAAPARYTSVLQAIGAIQAVVLGGKIFTGSENNWLFDGAALCTYAFSRSPRTRQRRAVLPKDRARYAAPLTQPSRRSRPPCHRRSRARRCSTGSACSASWPARTCY